MNSGRARRTLAERLSGRPMAESRSPPKSSARTRTNGGAAAWRGRLVERRQRQRLPQQLPQPRRLAVLDEPFLHRSPGDAASTPSTVEAPPRELERPRQCAGRKAVPPGQRIPLEEARDQMPAVAAARGTQLRPPPSRSIDRDAEARLRGCTLSRGANRVAGTGTSPGNSRTARAVRCRRAHRSALAVRRGAPAKTRARLEHEHARPVCVSIAQH